MAVCGPHTLLPQDCTCHVHAVEEVVTHDPLVQVWSVGHLVPVPEQVLVGALPVQATVLQKVLVPSLQVAVVSAMAVPQATAEALAHAGAAFHEAAEAAQATPGTTAFDTRYGDQSVQDPPLFLRLRQA